MLVLKSRAHHVTSCPHVNFRYQHQAVSFPAHICTAHIHPMWWPLKTWRDSTSPKLMHRQCLSCDCTRGFNVFIYPQSVLLKKYVYIIGSTVTYKEKRNSEYCDESCWSVHVFVLVCLFSGCWTIELKERTLKYAKSSTPLEHSPVDQRPTDLWYLNGIWICSPAACGLLIHRLSSPQTHTHTHRLRACVWFFDRSLRDFFFVLHGRSK